MTAVVRPLPGPARPYHFPKFERLSLENGINVIVAPVAKLPVVTATLVTEAGAVTERAGREGVAQLTASALLEGTVRLKGDDLSQRLELLGASLDSEADWDSAMLSMTVLSSRLPRAFGLLAEIVQEPAFPEREVERLKAERLSEILQLRAEPRGLADEMFARFVYDARSRYGKPLEGSEESVTGLSRRDVEDFHRERHRPRGATLVIVGDVTVAGGESLAREHFGEWRAEPLLPARVDDGPARRTRAVHIVEKAEAPQSELRIGHPGLPRKHPDYFAVLVMNMLLGGLFSSRINLNLREAHGYTYGASSEFDWRRGAGPFAISSAVKSDVTDAATREVMSEIERMRSEEVSDDELSLATSYLEGVFPIRFETTTAIARALAAMVVYDLPGDYFDIYRPSVRAVSRDDVLRAARNHIRPDEVQIVVVGDPGVVRKPLERAKVGPVLAYDANGRFRSDARSSG